VKRGPLTTTRERERALSKTHTHLRKRDTHL
jgi:hypothetical protein